VTQRTRSITTHVRTYWKDTSVDRLSPGDRRKSFTLWYRRFIFYAFDQCGAILAMGKIPLKHTDEMIPFDDFVRQYKDEAGAANIGKLRDDVKKELYKAYAVQMRELNFDIIMIAGAMGISTVYINEWLNDDPEFNKAWQQARSNVIESLEREAIRRARDGVMEPVVSNGRVVMDPRDATKPLQVRVYSDRLMEFLLKGNKREIYGDKVQAEVNHGYESAALERFKSLLTADNPPAE